jgi:hypothetical protein
VVVVGGFFWEGGKGYKKSHRIGYNCSPSRTLSLVFPNYKPKFDLIRLGLYLWELFCRYLVVMWAYADPYMGLPSRLSHVP